MKIGPVLSGMLAMMVLLFILPSLGSVPATFLIANLLIVASLAYSINLVSGFTDYISFGHAVFVGIGAYALGVLTVSLNLQPVLGIGLSLLVGSVMAAAIGFLVLRLKSTTFALVTLVILVAAQLIVSRITQLGGSGGISIPSKLDLSYMYYSIWSLVLAGMILTHWRAGKRGRGTTVASGGEFLATNGVGGETKPSILLFLVSGGFAAATGAILTWETAGVNPAFAFNVPLSLEMIAMIVIGGRGTTAGPFVGATIVYLITNLLAGLIPGVQITTIGLLLIVSAFFLPGGIIGFLASKSSRTKEILG